MTSDKTKDGRKFLHFLGTEDFEKEVSDDMAKEKARQVVIDKRMAEREEAEEEEE